MKKVFIPLLLIALICGIFIGSRLWANPDTYQLLRIFNKILKDIEDNYVDEVNSDSLVRGAIEGLIGSLKDPHTVYLTKDEYEALRISTEGEFGGIGASIGKRNEKITVISPLEGTPAYRAGLLPGDIILMVDSMPTEGKSVELVIKQIRGKPGTKVVLTIQRETMPEAFNVEIVRAIIKLNAVRYFGMVNTDIGYIYLATFSRTADAELKNALDSLFIMGAKKIIFDLRLNSGGLLQEGVAVGELFLSKGEDVVSTRGRVEPPRIFKVQKSYSYKEFPMITLVDGSSASASEIVAGALQDWDRSLIMGTHTFGKGSVQNVIPLEDGGALKLTTARWYTPSGRCIDKPFAEQETIVIETKVDTLKEKAFITLGPLKRKVYGRGGINADMVVEPPKRTKLETEVAIKNLFFDFTLYYTNIHKNIDKAFVVDEKVLNEFLNYLREKKLEPSEAQFDSSRIIFSQMLKQEIFTNLWGQKEGFRIRVENDPLVAKAVQLLKEAKEQKDLFRLTKK